MLLQEILRKRRNLLMGRIEKRKSLEGVYSFPMLDFELTGEQLRNLEQAGRVTFTPALKAKLNDAITFYIRQRERYNQAPSRGNVEKHLKKLEDAIPKILQPLNSVHRGKDIDVSLDRALQRIQHHAGKSFFIEGLSEQLYGLQEAVKKAKEEFKTEYREDTGADDAKNSLHYALTETYKKAKGKKGARLRFIEAVNQSLPEAYRIQNQATPDSEAKQIKRTENKAQ